MQYNFVRHWKWSKHMWGFSEVIVIMFHLEHWTIHNWDASLNNKYFLILFHVQFKISVKEVEQEGGIFTDLKKPGVNCEQEYLLVDHIRIFECTKLISKLKLGQ